MYLQNLDLQPLDYNVLKSELFAEMNAEPVASEQDVEKALTSIYVQANEKLREHFFGGLEGFSKQDNAELMELMGWGWLEKLRKYLCDYLSQDSNADEIIEKILDFISTVIPGSILIKALIRKVIKYILNLGYHALCQVPAGAGR